MLRGLDQATSMAAGMELIAYLNDPVDIRRGEPRGDLISHLVHLEEVDDSLSHQELLAMAFLLLIAGRETTVNLIGNGMLALTVDESEPVWHADFFLREMKGLPLRVSPPC